MNPAMSIITERMQDLSTRIDETMSELETACTTAQKAWDNNWLAVTQMISIVSLHAKVKSHLESGKNGLAQAIQTYENTNAVIKREIDGHYSIEVPKTKINKDGSVEVVSEQGYDTYPFYANDVKTIVPWIKETFNDPRKSRTESGKIQPVSYRNKGGEISCTYYTLRKLRDRGLGYPFKDATGANGGKWFTNCSDSVPKFSGENCLETILTNFAKERQPVKNIVISFSRKESAGHVVLIDELYKDPLTGEIKVKWSDMNGTKEFPLISEPEDFNPSIVRTLDEFWKYYKRLNYNLNGAVVIGE